MKFKNLMDIPTGYKMRMTKSFCGYPTGTVITRGHDSAPCDDERSVAFTLPDGNYIYFEAHEVEPVPYEKPVLLPEDKVQIEMTALEAYCIYAILGNTVGSSLQRIYDTLQLKLDEDAEVSDKLCEQSWDFYKDDRRVIELVEATVFEKRSEKVKEISQIKEQLKELEKRLEELENE